MDQKGIGALITHEFIAKGLEGVGLSRELSEESYKWTGLGDLELRRRLHASFFRMTVVIYEIAAHSSLSHQCFCSSLITFLTFLFLLLVLLSLHLLSCSMNMEIIMCMKILELCGYRMVAIL